MYSQTKPIRSATGGDITQPTLQMTLDNLGIEKAVTNLSFAEKRLLIIISLTEQLNQATNDFGKTIESPANQTRILSQQWERFTRALGNLFLPIVAKILPYLNAILMVLTEIINLVAGLLGFKIEDFDYGVSGLSDSFLEMEESMNGASESAKKLKSGLRGFDKLNVISTPSAGGSGSGAGAGGIDPEIMEAFNKAYKKYNDMLEDVRMKANDIRDSMLEWLGFTDGTYTNLKRIGGILAIITGYKIIKTISKVVKLLGGTGLFKALTKLLKPIKQLGFKGGLAEIFTTAKSSILKFLPVFGKLAIVIVIITAIVSVFVKAYKTSEKFRNKVKTMVENVTELFKTLSDKVGGAFKKIWEIFEPKWKIYKKVGKLILGWLESDITRGLANFVDVVSGTAEIITKLINGDFKGAFDALKNMIKNLRDNWKDHINEMSDKIRNFISDFDKDIVPKFKEKLEDMVEKIKDLPEKFGYWIGQAVGKIIKKIEETDWEAEGKKIVDKIVANIKLTEARAKEIINNIKSKLSKIITSTDWKSLGKDILLGIVKGLVWTTSIKNEIAKGFIKGLKDALKIHSPSRLVIENKIGDNVFYGITEGLDNSMSGLKQTANQMVDTLKTEINKSSSKVEPMFYNPNIIVDNNNGTINENKNSSPINSSSFIPTFIIQVGSKEVARTVLTDLQDMAKSNGKPITIQG